jgi:hypothetical protein
MLVLIGRWGKLSTMIGRNNFRSPKKKNGVGKTGKFLSILRRFYSKYELKLSIFQTLFSKYS